MARIRLLCGCIAGVALLASGRARGQASSAPIQLEYKVSESCPNEPAFVARLHARMAGFRRGDATESPKRVRIWVDSSGEASLGRLSIVEPSGETTTREVAGPTCEQVIDALAFVVALAFDASAFSVPQPSLETPKPSAPATAPEGALPVRSDTRWQVSAAGHAGMTGAAPVGLELSVPVFVELENQPLPDAHGWARSARIGFERGFGASVEIPQGTAGFTWTLGRLDLCAARFLAPELTVGPCLGVDVGEIGAVGSIAHPRQASPFWLAFGGLVRGRWQVRRPVFLEVDAGVVLPVFRYTFVFDPQTPLYTVPPVGARLSGGVGVYFL
jgi:hypothetical protein